MAASSLFFFVETVSIPSGKEFFNSVCNCEKIRTIKKDAFFPVTLGINGMSTYTQWNYRTKDGFQALMALNSTTGFIITENADCFITIIVEEVPDANMVWHRLPEEKAFLEAVCDNFCYSEP